MTQPKLLHFHLMLNATDPLIDLAASLLYQNMCAVRDNWSLRFECDLCCFFPAEIPAITGLDENLGLFATRRLKKAGLIEYEDKIGKFRRLMISCKDFQRR